MRFCILHESKNRMRVHIKQNRMTLYQADLLEYYLKDKAGIKNVRVFDRTGNAIIHYTTTRTEVLKYLVHFSYRDKNTVNLLPMNTGRELSRDSEDKLILMTVMRLGAKYLFPPIVGMVITILRSIKFIKKGVISLLRGKIDVNVLDATAISISILRNDMATSASIIYLLNVGELLENWTYKKSVNDLAQTIALKIDKVWINKNGTEELVSVFCVEEGDEVVVRMGSTVPFDGVVVSGEAGINQASITGEPYSIRKAPGSYVYAGTVVEDGECRIQVDKSPGQGQYDRIVGMIEKSERLKSKTESKAAGLADKLVPMTFLATALVYGLTRSFEKALSVLMVDFSCALKLSIPLAVLSSMRECSSYDMVVKGGKFLEIVAEADTIVFDKTGTLTQSIPKVKKIITFNGRDEDEMLRLAACLEEHYPHSVANAVVKEAKNRNLHHEEKHSKVEYVVAHGIASTIEGDKVIIGSYHFVFQDEQCAVPEGEEEKFYALPSAYSLLYLAISNRLSAVICIEDPLKDEAANTLRRLKELGIKKTVMLTGDNKKNAAHIAEQIGIDEFYAEVLPEFKAKYIMEEQKLGNRVLMIGDGINDSPALSAADCGIAVSSGAAIAREVADITVSTRDLNSLAELRILSQLLTRRIRHSYDFILGFNLLLLGLGITGQLTPTTLALLHNASTIGLGLKNMTKLK